MRGLVLAFAALLPAAAAAAPVDFSIPAEPADQGLLEFSRQSATPVLFSSDALKSVRTNGVYGHLEREEALNQLLWGTGFIAERNTSGAFVITAVGRPVPRPSQAAPAGPATPADLGRETTRLDPFLVMGRSELGVDQTEGLQVAGGDLDLPRTENDALPFMVFSRARIGDSGAVQLDDFLREQVLENDAALPPPNELGGNSAFLGGTSLNLRGFGTDQTLVLLNGLPMPQLLSGASAHAGSFTTRQADVDLIPLDLVERVEVLPASASALYSGNPVGGVINIVLRPIEDRTELTTTYSNGMRADAPFTSVSLMHGQLLLDGRLGIRLNLAYTQSVPATEQELGYIRKNLASHPDLAYSPPPAAEYRATPEVASDSGAPLFGPGTPSISSVAPGADGSGGLAAFAGRAGVPSTALFAAPGGDATSSASSNYAYGRRQTTESVFGSATYDLFSNLQLGFNGYGTRTRIHPGWDVFNTQGPLLLPADSPFNPFGQDVDVLLNETPRLGENYEQAEVDLYSAMAGFLARLPDGWHVAGDAQYSHTFTHYRGLAGVDQESWQNLVDEGLYNPLRDTQRYGPPSAFYQHALLYFGGPGRFLTLDNYQTLDTVLRVSRQNLPLPTGKGSVIVGADYSINHLASFNDIQSYGDGTEALTSGRWQGRTLQQLSASTEAQAPLLPARWLPGWLKSVSVDAAGRYNISNTTYGSNVAPTVGAKVGFAGGISLRASIANTNRFPTPGLSHFYPVPGGVGNGAGSAPIQSQITDPRRGNETDYISSTDTPQVAVRPEADLTKSAGIVFQTGKTHRLRLSIDYFDTRKTGEQIYLDPQDVLTYESLLPGRVTRAAPSPGDPYGVGPVTFILTGNINSAWRRSQDLDSALDYTWTGFAGGTLELYARWLRFLSWQREVLPNSPIVDELNLPDTSGLDIVRNRANFGAGWTGKHVGFGVDGQYFARRTLPELLWKHQGSNHISSYAPYGAYLKSDVARFLPWTPARLSLLAQLRIDNLFNANLPSFPDNPAGTGVEPYGDWRGRVFSFSLTASY